MSATLDDERRPHITYEPASPVNWPDGHVSVAINHDLEPAECIRVGIHGDLHYLHASTARELQRKLATRLTEWNAIATAHRQPPV